MGTQKSPVYKYFTVDFARWFYIFCWGVSEKMKYNLIEQHISIIFRIPGYPVTQVIFFKKIDYPGIKNSSIWTPNSFPLSNMFPLLFFFGLIQVLNFCSHRLWYHLCTAQTIANFFFILYFKKPKRLKLDADRNKRKKPRYYSDLQDFKFSPLGTDKNL